jgi:hypothetical protein
MYAATVADLRVELLVVEDCPHLEQARRDLESVLGRGIIEVPIQLILVGNLDDAEFLDFQGSPTIRINGDDVVPQPDLPVALACRVYRDAEGRMAGSPPIESIRAAVDAQRRDRLEAFQREEAAKVAEFAREAEAAGLEGTAAGLEGTAAGLEGTAATAQFAPDAAPAEASIESEGKPREG